ncbi:hypothetical protein AC249_AIPGENE19884 [Exaiptasia diaphana]|nr:hypothetical protein AC249_AIPGENE19884 [Exaiptasia diaphana]
METSYAVVRLLLFFCGICEMRAAPLEELGHPNVVSPTPQSADAATLEKFQVHITENGTKLVEDIYVDKQNDIEYFKVPPHNGLSETDNLYDFRMNITVSRVKKDRVCQITPLPDHLPRPDMLSKGLQSLSGSPPSHNIRKISRQWTIGPIVDKSTLRKEVRDFCGQFPVYRLEPFNADSVSYGIIGRSKRDTRRLKLCTNVRPPTGCYIDNWLYTCQIVEKRCVYHITCRVNQQRSTYDCGSLSDHQYDSLTCCTPSCP